MLTVIVEKGIAHVTTGGEEEVIG
jgi:hypothetical protein